MGWNDVRSGDGTSVQENHLQVTPNTTKIIHILLDDGEEPMSFWSHYIPEAGGGKGRSVICPGKTTCPVCIDGGYRTRRRHAINVYDYDSKSVKIFETGNQVMQQLKLILDQYGSFDKIDVGIRRIGERQQTQYIVVPMPREMPFDKEATKDSKFDIDILKSPNKPERIKEIMSGRTVEETKPAATQKELPLEPATVTPAKKETPSPVPQVKESVPTILQFGKYKGKTLDEVAKMDLNYVKWLAENVADEGTRQEALSVYDVHKNSGTSVADLGTVKEEGVKEESPKSGETEKHQLLTEVYALINEDTRYSTNFQLVVKKMREATKSPTFPNGKTLLQEYTADELKKLKTSLTESGS